MAHDLPGAVDRAGEARRRRADRVPLHLQLGLEELGRRRHEADGHARGAAGERVPREVQIDRRWRRRAPGGQRIGARLVALEERPAAEEHAIGVHAERSASPLKAARTIP